MTFFETIPNNHKSMEEIADSLLSTNDAEVIAKKRETFKNIILGEINKNFGTMYAYMNIKCSESITKKTFDEWIVN